MFEDALMEALSQETIDVVRVERIRSVFCQSIQSRFATPNEETLAGGLANTIAGRIANYFDFHGGAYTVDAACASSLIAIANAGRLLYSGEADTVVVGAVDISLDPFELVGFSRLGALAKSDMRVFDANAEGFWPGEGSGFAVLVSEDEAIRRGLPVLAYVRGWGISSDGAGGLTRPDAEGQYLALQRAYRSAAVDPADVAYIEAHGTGTPVGDPVEVRALAKLRNGGGNLRIGSIKANIGHTKAAAGFAGLIKAVWAIREGIIPPHVGCLKPHPVFDEVENSIKPALNPDAWPNGRPRITGVSGFGFGGVNVIPAR
jgi:enediyne polyketide synthase